jgi:hypothetical protein
VRRFRADSGTIHFLQQDGLLHLAAAGNGRSSGRRARDHCDDSVEADQIVAGDGAQ